MNYMKLTKEQKETLSDFKDDAFEEYWDYINNNIDDVIPNPYENDDGTIDEVKYEEFRDLCFEQLEIN